MIASKRSAQITNLGSAVSRHYDNWIDAFLKYSSYGEAPRHFYFWTAVSTIAGALRRRVWIDQFYFRWHANFYICLVAPPGIVSKTTTANIGMSLLKDVPGVYFGPDVVTWPALVSEFAKRKELFQYGDQWIPQCALTLSSGEFGNLLDPRDKDMVDLLVTLWDGKEGAFEKVTKHSGNDQIENPWINLIACTTPAWIAGNFPEYMIGGGLTSRMVFVYADQKANYVAYPGLSVQQEIKEMQPKLVEDLKHIAENLVGEMRLTPGAVEWGQAWYQRHYKQRPIMMDPERFGGYLARKQTMMHKVAMILSVSEGDSLMIDTEHLEVADTMLTDLEPDMQFVFSKIGQSAASSAVERLINFVHARPSGVSFPECMRHVHAQFPSIRDFENIFEGACRAGFLRFSENLVYPGVELPRALKRD